MNDKLTVIDNIESQFDKLNKLWNKTNKVIEWDTESRYTSLIDDRLEFRKQLISMLLVFNMRPIISGSFIFIHETKTTSAQMLYSIHLGEPDLDKSYFVELIKKERLIKLINIIHNRNRLRTQIKRLDEYKSFRYLINVEVIVDWLIDEFNMELTYAINLLTTSYKKVNNKPTIREPL